MVSPMVGGVARHDYDRPLSSNMPRPVDEFGPKRGERLDWNLRHEYPNLSGFPLLLSAKRPMKL